MEKIMNKITSVIIAVALSASIAAAQSNRCIGGYKNGRCQQWENDANSKISVMLSQSQTADKKEVAEQSDAILNTQLEVAKSNPVIILESAEVQRLKELQMQIQFDRDLAKAKEEAYKQGYEEGDSSNIGWKIWGWAHIITGIIFIIIAAK